MSRLFYHVMQDNAGNLLFGVSGTMRLAGSGTLATIYGDEALTVILPNPMTNHPSYGSFKCFLPNGDYDFYMAKAGYTFETLTGVQGFGTMAHQDAHAVAITGGTASLTNLTVTGLLPTMGVDAAGTIRASGFSVLNPAGAPQTAYYSNMASGADRYFLRHDGAATSLIQGPLLLGTTLNVAGGATLTNLTVTGLLPTVGIDAAGTIRASNFSVLNPAGASQIAYYSNMASGADRYFLKHDGTAPSLIQGPLALGTTLNVAGAASLTSLTVTGLMPTVGVDAAGTIRASTFSVIHGAVVPQIAYYSSLSAGGDPERWFLRSDGDCPSLIQGKLLLHSTLDLGARITLRYERGTEHGIVFYPINDDGATSTISFVNAAQVQVGSIQTTASTTSYNTTSDARLKCAIEPLRGALDVLRALRPVSHRWKADNSQGVGLLAHEVAEVVDGVITGEKDAVDADGQILPQQIDYSKLVPWLIASVKELTQQVEMLQAQLAAVHA